MTTRAIVAAFGAACATPLHACGDALPGASHRAESARYAIAWQVRPSPIPVGEHFVIDLVVCPRDGAPAPSRVRADATMPAHRHGMNYRPTVESLGAARYHIVGMLFHMPGHWVIEFELGDDASVDRIRADVRL